MDSFLLNKKGLEEVSILHKNFCNMHIARRNMHIAIKSILPLTHARARACFPTTFVARRPVRVVGGGGRVEGMKEGRGGGEGNDDMIRHRLPPSVGGTGHGRVAPTSPLSPSFFSSIVFVSSPSLLLNSLEEV
jgi:hypothetical protein